MLALFLSSSSYPVPNIALHDQSSPASQKARRDHALFCIRTPSTEINIHVEAAYRDTDMAPFEAESMDSKEPKINDEAGTTQAVLVCDEEKSIFLIRWY
jgi:hypothetical protein